MWNIELGYIAYMSLQRTYAYIYKDITLQIVLVVS